MRFVWISAAAVTLAVLPWAQGTLVVDLKPGGGFPGSGFWNGESHALGDELLFAGDDGGGINLWISDGTSAGTRLVHDIHPGGSALPHEFTALGDEVVFVATGPGGIGVWKTDGTAAGTLELAQGGELGFMLLTALEDSVAFISYGATAKLWVTDGTPAGTRVVTSIPPPYDLFPFGAGIGFAVWYPGAGGHYELWRSDGTAEATALVKSFGEAANPADFTMLGDALFFTEFEFATGRELWRSDGTTAGTALFADLTPGAASTNPAHLEVLDGGRLVFADFVGLFGPPRRLWTSDGTVAGTQVIFADPVLEVVEVKSVGARAFFFAAPELWWTDGTAGGTERIGGPLVYSLVPPGPLQIGSGDEIAFRASSYDTGADFEPWHASGDGVAQLADVHPGSAGSDCAAFRRAGKLLFFRANDGTTGSELHAVPIALAGAWVGEPIGTGCSASAPAPALSLAGAATVGGAVTLELADAEPSAAALLYWSLDRAATDLGGDCTVYLASPAILLAHATDAAGAFSLPVAIPPVPALAGLAFYFQDLIAAPGGPLLGASELSAALEVVLGP